MVTRHVLDDPRNGSEIEVEMIRPTVSGATTGSLLVPGAHDSLTQVSTHATVRQSSSPAAIAQAAATRQRSDRHLTGNDLSDVELGNCEIITGTPPTPNSGRSRRKLVNLPSWKR